MSNNWNHLPKGSGFRRVLENSGKFTPITELEKWLAEKMGSQFSELVEIREGELWDILKTISDFWNIPTPNLYWAKDANFHASLKDEMSASILLGKAYNTLSTEYLKAIISHEFFHGLQNPSRDITKSSHTIEEDKAFYHPLEHQADLHAAAFTSIPTVIEALKNTGVHPEGLAHPSTENRIQTLRNAEGSKEWTSWVERHDQESLENLLQASSLHSR